MGRAVLMLLQWLRNWKRKALLLSLPESGKIFFPIVIIHGRILRDLWH